MKMEATARSHVEMKACYCYSFTDAQIFLASAPVYGNEAHTHIKTNFLGRKKGKKRKSRRCAIMHHFSA